MPFGNFLNRRGSNMSQAPMPRPTNPAMAPQMPVQGPMPYGMPAQAGSDFQAAQAYKQMMDQRMAQQAQQPPSMPFAAGDPRYVNALPYMGPPVTGPAPDMSKQLGPLMGGPFNGTMMDNFGQSGFVPPPGQVGLGQAAQPAPNQPQMFGQIGGGIGQLYGQLGVNNGAQLFGQPSSAPGMAPNSAPGAAPTSGPVATPTGPASVNMF